MIKKESYPTSYVQPNATACKANATDVHGEQAGNQQQRELTPQELQQRIHVNQKGTPRPTKYNSPKGKEKEAIHPDTLAAIAEMEAGSAYILFLDDGSQVTLHAAKIAQPAILGLLVKFAAQLATQDIKVV